VVKQASPLLCHSFSLLGTADHRIEADATILLARNIKRGSCNSVEKLQCSTVNY
jgi:hypothetical protein